MDDFRDYMPGSLTEQSMKAWANLPWKTQIERLTGMALMFEARLSELDPNYRAYPFGLVNANAIALP